MDTRGCQESDIPVENDVAKTPYGKKRGKKNPSQKKKKVKKKKKNTNKYPIDLLLLSPIT